MCFSAEADIAAGVVVGAVGADALGHAERPEQLALASLPALFAAHQITEAFVWWDLTGVVPASPGQAAMWLYLAFAFWVLPVLVPLALLAVEPDPRRRRLMGACAAVGAVVAVAYATAMATGPVGAEVDGRHIAYSLPPAGPGELIDAAYLFAGCVPFLASSHRLLVVFGVVNAAAVVALFWLTSTGRISLWCAWAAVTSVVIAAHLRRTAADDALQAAPARSLRASDSNAASAGP